MILKYFVFSISIAFVSWTVALMITPAIAKSRFYQTKLTHLNFIPGENANKLLGMDAFKWLVINTFFRFFNPKLNLKKSKGRGALVELRKEMTLSEVSHLVGFLLMTIVAIYGGFTQRWSFTVIAMLVNILMNLYPSLLQQDNKRRIDRVLKR